MSGLLQIRRAIAGNIRRRRLRAGMTQGELARSVRLSRTEIVNLETGKHAPSLDSLVRLARSLGTTPSALLRERA